MRHAFKVQTIGQTSNNLISSWFFSIVCVFLWWFLVFASIFAFVLFWCCFVWLNVLFAVQSISMPATFCTWNLKEPAGAIGNARYFAANSDGKEISTAPVARLAALKAEATREKEWSYMCISRSGESQRECMRLGRHGSETCNMLLTLFLPVHWRESKRELPGLPVSLGRVCWSEAGAGCCWHLSDEFHHLCILSSNPAFPHLPPHRTIHRDSANLQKRQKMSLDKSHV